MAYLKPQTPLKDLNSGDYFYPLTTIDQVQKSDGSRVQDYDLGNVALEDSETAPGPGTPQMTTLMNMVYPIGSIYMSVNATSPASLFGGTWELILDRFLLAAGSTYSAGTTGGSATHTHTIAHTHTYAHTHTTPATTTGNHTLTLAESPAHTHARGTMNITGSAGAVDFGGTGWCSFRSYSGAFYRGDSDTGNWLKSVSSTAAAPASGAARVLNFDASKTWSGATDSKGGGGAHSHPQVATTTNSQSASTTSAASDNNSGSASTLPPYLAVYMWKRTA